MPSPMTPSAGSRSKSTTRSSTSSSCAASAIELASWTSWPAAPSVASIRLANIRSGATARTRATIRRERERRSQVATPPEVLADALGPAPHLHDLRAALVDVPNHELALDPLVVEESQRSLDRLGGGRVAEAVGDQEPEMPVGPRVRLRVHLAEQHRRVHVPLLLVEDPQVELQVRPIIGQRVDDLLERVGERH